MTFWLWGIGGVLLLAITNAVSYQRGNNAGYDEGYEKGVVAKLTKIRDGMYRIEDE